MKKGFFLIPLLLVGAIFLVGVHGSVHAQDELDLDDSGSEPAPAGVTAPPAPIPNPARQLDIAAEQAQLKTKGQSTTLSEFAGRILGGVLYLVGLIFLGYTIFGGVTWMIARGNGEEVNKAKETIISSVIGLVVVTLGYVLTNFVITLLQKTAVAG